jgi:hypothetical protein
LMYFNVAVEKAASGMSCGIMPICAKWTCEQIIQTKKKIGTKKLGHFLNRKSNKFKSNKFERGFYISI